MCISSVFPQRALNEVVQGVYGIIYRYCKYLSSKVCKEIILDHLIQYSLRNASRVYIQRNHFNCVAS